MNSTIQLENQLNHIFHGATDQKKFDKGYDDAMTGKPNLSKCVQYNKGYSLGYELGGRQTCQ